MTVAVRTSSSEAKHYARTLKSDAARLLSTLGLKRCELSIMLIDDPAIRALNREFRDKDSPTDVLSFSQIEDRDSPASGPEEVLNSSATVLGDVVISIDTAFRQADRRGIDRAVHLRTLLVHGMLHLIGYDHERSRADARRMFARQRELEGKLAAGSRIGARRAKR